MACSSKTFETRSDSVDTGEGAEVRHKSRNGRNRDLPCDQETDPAICRLPGRNVSNDRDPLNWYYQSPLPNSRSVGTQTGAGCGGPEDYLSASILASQPSVSTGRPARPHTVTVLCVTLAVVCGLSHFPTVLPFTAPTRGVVAACLMFLVFATLQFPDGVLVRPHRAVWRFIKGCSVLYLCLICFLLFQDIMDVRRWLSSLDEDAGKDVIEQSYADGCVVFTWDHPESIIANVKDRLDIFIVAHLIGWLAKAVVIRNHWMLWTLSLMFEWMEITFRHILPNFHECWWDHLLFDVFGCNLLGISVGMRVVKYFEMKDYHWQWHDVKRPVESPWSRSTSSNDIHDIDVDAAGDNTAVVEDQAETFDMSSCSFSRPTREVSAEVIREASGEIDLSNRVRNARQSVRLPLQRRKHSEGSEALTAACWTPCSYLNCLLPFSWTSYRWPGLFSSSSAFVGLTIFLFAVTSLDLNLFFLKAQLGLLPSHWILILRSLFWSFAAASGTRDFYEFAVVDNRRLGVQGWLNFAIVGAEILLYVKNWDALPAHGPMPAYIQIIWASYGVAATLVFLYLYLKEQTKRKPGRVLSFVLRLLRPSGHKSSTGKDD